MRNHILKVLCLRFFEVLNDIIFLSRMFSCGIDRLYMLLFVTSKVVEDIKKSNSKELIFKLEFRRHSIGYWDFMDKGLERKGFGSRCQKWISGCLSLVSFAVIINCKLWSLFNWFRDVRCEDTLSPFLLTPVVCVLSRTLTKGSYRSVSKVCVPLGGENGDFSSSFHK